MAQIFLSYAHRNAERAGQIADGLAAEGYSLWWDRALKASADYTMDIERELESAKCVVVVWSNDARNSLWVRAEANAALEAGKLVQLVTDKARPPLPFTMLQFVDMSNWRGGTAHPQWGALTHNVHALFSGKRAPNLPSSAQANASAMFAPMIAVGAGSLGLVAVAASLAALMVRAPQSADAIGLASIGVFAGACLGLGYMLMRTIEIGLASRRSP